SVSARDQGLFACRRVDPDDGPVVSTRRQVWTLGIDRVGVSDDKLAGLVHRDSHGPNQVSSLRDHPLNAGSGINMGHLTDAEVLVMPLETSHINIVAAHGN